FSSYILLRVSQPEGHWPHGWLNIPLGTANTLVLITSSITTVMAWASCKMNQYGRFKFFHACTLLCALVFIGIKSYEYHDKFTHYSLTLKDGSIVDGHFVSSTPDFDVVKGTGSIPLRRHEVNFTKKQGKELEEELNKVYDLHSPQAKEVKHEEVKVEASKIARTDTYGPWHNTYTAIYFTL